MQKLVCVIAVAGLATGAFATPSTHEARVFCDQQLVAGGSVSNAFALQQGEVAAFMTTPVNNFGTNFASPDTIIDLRDSSNALIVSDDDAGTDARGGATVGPVRGSMVRYGVAASGTYDFRVRGFGATDAGAYIGTYVRFTPGGSSDFTDSEANDNVATAQSITLASESAKLGFGSISAGDLDYFAITVNVGDIVTAFTVPLSNLTAAAPSFSAVDTLLDIRAADGSIIATSDDAGSDAYGVGSVGPVRGSAVRYEATAAGTLYLSVRGFSSEDVGAYALAVSICDVPTPGTASAFVLAGLPLVRRRRR
jgi:hypothetical protein